MWYILPLELVLIKQFGGKIKHKYLSKQANGINNGFYISIGHKLASTIHPITETESHMGPPSQLL